MSKTKTTARNDGASINFDELPDARVTIDLKQVPDGDWVAYDPDDNTSITGRAETAPRSAEDYCRQIVAYLEGNR